MLKLEEMYPEKLFILEGSAFPTARPGNKKMISTLERVYFSDSREALDNILTLFKLKGGEFSLHHSSFCIDNIKENEYVIIRYLTQAMSRCYHASSMFNGDSYIWNKTSSQDWFLSNFGLYKYVGIQENPNFKKILAKIIRTKQKNKAIIKNSNKIVNAYRCCQSVIISNKWLKEILADEIKKLNFDENRVTFVIDQKK